MSDAVKPGAKRSIKRSDLFRWGFSILLLVFGLLSHDPKTGTRWFVAAGLLYGVPLIAQFVPRNWVRVYGIYVGLFILLQAVISAHFVPDTFITRAPYINNYIDIRGNHLHGISGVQHMTTDANGFRVTKPVNYDAKAGYRIFFIGASTVAQDWIGDKKTFAHLVQESLSEALGRNVETINTAVPGLRAIHHLATMRYVADYHPDLFVIVPGANDWGLQITLHYDKSNPDRFAHTGVHVDRLNFRIGFMEFARNYTLRHSVLGRGFKPLWGIVSSPFVAAEVGYGDTPERKVSYAEFYNRNAGSLYRKDKRTYKPKSVHRGYVKTMKEIVAFCKKSGAKCVLVTHPHSFKPGTTLAYRKRFWMTPAFEKYTLTYESMAHIANLYNRHLIELGRKSGLPVCDLAAQVPPSLKYFYDEIHYNIEGSRYAAEALHHCLKRVIRPESGPKLSRAR